MGEANGALGAEKVEEADMAGGAERTWAAGGAEGARNHGEKEEQMEQEEHGE